MNRTLIIFTLIFGILTCKGQGLPEEIKFDDAIPVLNFGTFHMGYSPDASTTEFDEHDPMRVGEVHGIAQTLATFKPTVILVERLPENNKILRQSYHEYLKNPDMKFEHPTEIELLAFEVGRLAGTKEISGIDFMSGYNYGIAYDLKNSVDSSTYFRYMELLGDMEREYVSDDFTVLDQLKITNNPVYKDILININADMLTHVSSKGRAEGADEAAKFYHRNLVMYSNMNQIELTPADRVFILMGGTHTAYFDMWLERSPKYKLVDVYNYLK